MILKVGSTGDVDHYLNEINGAAARTHEMLVGSTKNPFDLLRQLKFEPAGRHPIENRELNIIEQVNQTWTFVVALLAARQLLRLHSDAGGFRLAPGAHAALPFDIMSEIDGMVVAETFAAVDYRNNNKLANDIEQLTPRLESHRYVFFMSPEFPGTRRLEQLERSGIQVWSVDPQVIISPTPSSPDPIPPA